MADKLTPQQQQAVADRGGRLLVSAAAGSGKTKVLVDRLMSYLTDPVNPANIDDFLLITYTKAAAAELRGKIAAKLTERVAEHPENVHLRRQLQRLYLTNISTVHSFCGDILREYAYRLDIPGDFRVADENECSEIRDRILGRMLADAYQHDLDNPAFRAFVDTQGLGRDDRQVPEIILQVYDSARCHLDPEQWLSECERLVSVGEMTDAGQTLYGAALIEQLHSWLQLQIDAMTQCADLAAEAENCQNAALLLRDSVNQLMKLHSCTTWEDVRANRQVDFGRLVFNKKMTDYDLQGKIKAVRNACKKGLEKYTRPFIDSSDDVLNDLQSSANAVLGLTQLVRRFGREYETIKRNRRIMDFGDLEHKMLDLLYGKLRSSPTMAAMDIGRRFREVMVDEYQDSNAVQDAIYNALTYERQNLFMVGDVKQSIYQFRLADPGIFLEKYHQFIPADEAKPGIDRKVVLSRNFRSGGAVLAACNDVFETCMCPQIGGIRYGEDEALYEGIPHIPLGGAEVELCCVDVQQETYPEEAAYVAAHIQKMLSSSTVRDGEYERRVRPEDIAILLRSPGSAGIYFHQALRNLGIRYTTGGGVDLLKTEEVSAFYAILQVVHNPRLDIPLVAALSSPVFGFTANDLAAIRGRNKNCSFYDALLMDDSEKSCMFVKTLQQLRVSAQTDGLTGLMEQILLRTSLEEIFCAMDDSAVRLENLQTFFQLAVDFEAGGNPDLGRFLEHLEAFAEKGLITAGQQSMPGCVTIMSIHKSKGLEFPVVYLCGLGREFNMESQQRTVLCHKSMGLGLSAVDTQNRLRYPTIAKRAISARIGQESISEEMRVLYVAMTRARDRLIMSYASKSLEKDLTDVVQRMEIGDKEILIREAICPGDWVLLTALQKTEAGALFALGGYPKHTSSGQYIWKIRVVTAPQLAVVWAQENMDHTLSSEVFEKIKRGLSFRYQHTTATVTPSKQTATGLKGRILDQEVAEFTELPQKQARQWRQPRSATEASQGAVYGNALHAVMQYIDYAVCDSEAAIASEIKRLVTCGFISEEHAQLVDASAIAAFFDTELGMKIRKGNVIREFKFSLLTAADRFVENLSDERVLLQGVVDCALLEEDGITIVDFKSDYVTEETIPQKIMQYAPQVEAYAYAMKKIYSKPIKARLLYFFRLGRFVSI